MLVSLLVAGAVAAAVPHAPASGTDRQTDLRYAISGDRERLTVTFGPRTKKAFKARIRRSVLYIGCAGPGPNKDTYQEMALVRWPKPGGSITMSLQLISLRATRCMVFTTKKSGGPFPVEDRQLSRASMRDSWRTPRWP